MCPCPEGTSPVQRVEPRGHECPASTQWPTDALPPIFADVSEHLSSKEGAGEPPIFRSCCDGFERVRKSLLGQLNREIVRLGEFRPNMREIASGSPEPRTSLMCVARSDALHPLSRKTKNKHGAKCRNLKLQVHASQRIPGAQQKTSQGCTNRRRRII